MVQLVGKSCNITFFRGLITHFISMLINFSFIYRSVATFLLHIRRSSTDRW